MKTLINDWLTHQRRGVCTVQEDLAPRFNEKHLMFDTQDEGGEEQGSSIFGGGGKTHTVCY